MSVICKVAQNEAADYQMCLFQLWLEHDASFDHLILVRTKRYVDESNREAASRLIAARLRVLERKDLPPTGPPLMPGDRPIRRDVAQMEVAQRAMASFRDGTAAQAASGGAASASAVPGGAAQATASQARAPSASGVLSESSRHLNVETRAREVARQSKVELPRQPNEVQAEVEADVEALDVEV